MIAYTRQILNQQRHARKRPKIGPVTPRDRPLKQGVDDLLALVLVEAWLAARRAFADQGDITTLLPGALPTSRRLAAHSNTPSDLGHIIAMQRAGVNLLYETQ